MGVESMHLETTSIVAWFSDDIEWSLVVLFLLLEYRNHLVHLSWTPDLAREFLLSLLLLAHCLVSDDCLPHHDSLLYILLWLSLHLLLLSDFIFLQSANFTVVEVESAHFGEHRPLLFSFFVLLLRLGHNLDPVVVVIAGRSPQWVRVWVIFWHIDKISILLLHHLNFPGLLLRLQLVLESIHELLEF